MFEEIPRRRRRLPSLTARRVALGPFVVGSGVLLAMLGGSVALAATVITASSLGFTNSAPPHAQQSVTAAASNHQRATHKTSANGGTKAGGQPVGSAAGSSTPAVGSAGSAPSAGSTPAAGPRLLVPGTSGLSGVPASTSVNSAAGAIPGPPPTYSAATSTNPSAWGSSLPSPGPMVSGTTIPTPGGSAPSSPSGNAIVYFTGWDQAAGRLDFEYASASSTVGGVQYAVSSTRIFSAGVAGEVNVISAGTLCPPAGSNCTLAQLISGAERGFFADVAIDQTGILWSVIERDSAASSPTASSGFGPASPSPTATPAASAPHPAPQPRSSAPSTAVSGTPSAAPSATR
ncbi:MAG: hypothetical protein JWN95_989 [Frankiales bacterium]|nr:hypothetical protein [Frankiales bacterium]